jgi:hypothetical protein
MKNSGGAKAMGTAGGGKTPSQISHRKDQPGFQLGEEPRNARKGLGSERHCSTHDDSSTPRIGRTCPGPPPEVEGLVRTKRDERPIHAQDFKEIELLEEQARERVKRVVGILQRIFNTGRRKDQGGAKRDHEDHRSQDHIHVR